jgi:hypothetical protein
LPRLTRQELLGLDTDASGLTEIAQKRERISFVAHLIQQVDHYSNTDVFDRIQRDDLIQQAIVAAVFAYDAAIREEKLPRKALPARAAAAGDTERWLVTSGW